MSIVASRVIKGSAAIFACNKGDFRVAFSLAFLRAAFIRRRTIPTILNKKIFSQTCRHFLAQMTFQEFYRIVWSTLLLTQQRDEGKFFEPSTTQQMRSAPTTTLKVDHLRGRLFCLSCFSKRSVINAPNTSSFRRSQSSLKWFEVHHPRASWQAFAFSRHFVVSTTKPLGVESLKRVPLQQAGAGSRRLLVRHNECGRFMGDGYRWTPPRHG